MSDPADDWQTEYEDEVPGVEEALGLCYAAGYWLRSISQPLENQLFVERATSPEGPWTTVLSDPDAVSIVFSANDIVALWVQIDGDYFLRWSDDAFDTYTDTPAPSGWGPFRSGTAGEMPQQLRWDGTDYGILLQSDPGTLSVTVGTSTDLSTLSVETSATGDHEAGPTTITGTASTGWAFTRIVKDDVAGVLNVLYRIYLVYADSLSGTWTHALAVETYDPDGYIAVWNGQQAAVLSQGDGNVWTANAPDGTYELAGSSPVPEGFAPIVSFTYWGASGCGIQWDTVGQQWVILGEGNDIRIAVTPDLGEPWQEVEIDLPYYDGQFYRAATLTNYDGEWFAVGAVEGAAYAVLTPGGAGAGWGLIL